ncbi:MAG: helix-turn-helix transcriptional regulator [Methylococcaceae bacterium]
MLGSYNHLNINWLIDESMPAKEHRSIEGDLERLPLPIPSDWGYGWIEIFHPCEGMDVCKASHVFTPQAHGKMFPVCEAKAEYPDPAFAMQTCPNGRIFHREYNTDFADYFGGETSLFRHSNGYHFEPSVDCSTSFDVNGFSITDASLMLLLGQDMAAVLFESLRIQKIPSIGTATIPLSISAIMQNSLPVHLQGALKRCYAQAKVLEYLCVLMGYFMNNRLVHEAPKNIRDIVRELHTDLLRLDGKIPTLYELASRYDVPARNLNEAFNREFGQSIFSFVNDYRLTQAHSALVQSNLSQKQLAARLGYSHVNHFITAFKRKFGCSPGSLRKNACSDFSVTSP